MAPIISYEDLSEEAKKNFCRDRLKVRSQKWEFRALENATKIVAISRSEATAFEMDAIGRWNRIDHFQCRQAILAEAKKSSVPPPPMAQEGTSEVE